MSFLGDLRQSVRVFKINPAYAILTVAMLGLGIGACTAIFTVVNAVLLKPLPYPDPNRLVQLQEISDRGTAMRVPEANFADWRKASHSFDGMAMFAGFPDVIRAGNQAERVFLTVVSQDFFAILKAKPAIGSGLVPEDFRVGAAPSLVIGYGMWKRAFGGSPDLTSLRIEVDGRQYSVAGVMPSQFNFPAGGDVWVPREQMFGNFNPSRSSHNFKVVARLRPGVSVTAASLELAGIAKSIHDNYTDVTAVGASATLLQQHMTESVSIALPVLLGAVGILLLVACANTMNLALTHIASRDREFAVRTALGASPTALIRLFLSQSILLGVIGGIFGVALSVAGVPALLALGSGNLPRLDEIHTDWRVLAFALAISLLAGVMLGMVPALRMRRVNLDETLKQGGRSQSAGAAAKRIRGALVIAQVGMTIVLLVAASLLGRSFVNLLQVNLGFQTEKRIDIQATFLSPQTPAARKAAVLKVQQILQQIRTIPGVVEAAAVRGLPLAAYNTNGRFTLEDGSNSGAYWPVYNAATPGYFEAVGIPLIRGRFFSETDGPDSPEVAVVSQVVANHVWPGQDPIGKRINFGNMDGDEHYMTIIGVAGDIRNDPAQALQGTIYANLLQRGSRSDFDFVVRGTGDSEVLDRTIAAEIRSIDPDASVRIKTFDQLFLSNLADRRFNLALLGSFGATALLLALMGIYAVGSYSVAQRTQEIGIRMALGADAGTVSRLFLSEGTWLVIAGLVVGATGAVITSRVLASFLFNVRPIDGPAYLLAIAPLILTALIANVFPALRAARVNPVIAIQGQ